MQKKFNAIYELTMHGSPMGNCESLQVAGEEAMKRAKSDDDHDGRKWAIATPAGRAIVVGGQQGWIGFTEYGDIGISKSYADSSFYRGNPIRVKNVIVTAVLEGHPLMGISNVLDCATLGSSAERVERYFTQIEEAFQRYSDLYN